MEYQDYYKILGLERDATPDQIKQAYRKLARKYHPDVSKEPDAEKRFKEIGEAYAVLKDPEKKAAYDQMGSNWSGGQGFNPPPNWDPGYEFRGNGWGDSANPDHSEFFESIFGRRAQQANQQSAQFNIPGEDHHAKIEIDLVDSYLGTQRSIGLKMPALDDQGHLRMQERTLEVKIPKGIRSGQHLRLAGQGSPGFGNGKAGDLYLEIVIKPNALFKVDGKDVTVALNLAPWEAALGATVDLPTPTGKVELNIPANTMAGKKLRLKGKGIPSQEPGDLYASVRLVTPPASTDSDKEAYQAMAKSFAAFNPRANG
ncbi:DnaJ C-terminal domain-containing protein [Polynucleobacter sp. HIN7]|uniref:DnaJ C-terminal domain-containing protein n=1 Tax=Polynucleobacter sp. HIN7 TaxID=3047866 RepID=UPI002572AF73|nr:DnaJ C-terminal domain-containing protein [Polynucleobacter sp. HIN7]BEI36964.1 DnaJ C-terminal domain-containing protein [Polynucleobacter sp. HIN7]